MDNYSKIKSELGKTKRNKNTFLTTFLIIKCLVLNGALHTTGDLPQREINYNKN